MTESLYVYGFVPADTESPTGVQGVEGSRVELLDVLPDTHAVVSRLPAGTLDPETLAERSEELAWVAQHGLVHERVVAWFVDHGDIVPVRLFTLYSSEDALRREVDGRAGAIRAQIERLRGLREWNLKVAYLPDRLMDRLADLSAEIRELDQQIGQAKPGHRYLLERKRQELAKAEAARGARNVAQQLLDALKPHAREVRALEPPRAAAADKTALVLNAALLVARAEEPAMREVAAEHAEDLGEIGIDVSFSGPWAPYRFTGEEGGT